MMQQIVKERIYLPNSIWLAKFCQFHLNSTIASGIIKNILFFRFLRFASFGRVAKLSSLSVEMSQECLDIPLFFFSFHLVGLLKRENICACAFFF